MVTLVYLRDKRDKGKYWKMTAPPCHTSTCFHGLFTICCASLRARFAPLSNPGNCLASYSSSKLRSPWAAILLQIFPAKVHINHRDSKGQICTSSSKKTVCFLHFFLINARGQPNPTFHLGFPNAYKNKTIYYWYSSIEYFSAWHSTPFAFTVSFLSPTLYTWPLTRSRPQHYEIFLCYI